MPGQFKYLFTPLTIGNIVVPNRISFSAHLTNLALNGLPSDAHVHYLEARARGGTGLIITEEQSVHPTDRAYEKLIEAFRPAVISRYKKITRAVHQYDSKIFAQLSHNGQQGSGQLSRLPVWAPSPVPDVLFRETPKQMELEDIKELVEYFCRCSIHVREGGFDGIELQFSHSSLARQRLMQKGVTFTPDISVMEIRGTEVHGFNVYSNQQRTFSGYDSIVTAMGNQANDALYFALKGRVEELHRIGDCVAPRKVDMAIHEGYVAGRRL